MLPAFRTATAVLLACLVLGYVPLGADTAQAESEPPESPPSATERFNALEKEVHQAIQEWSDKMRAEMEAARERGEAPKMARMVPPIGPFFERYFAAAADYAGTEDAVPFLMSVMRFSPAVDTKATTRAVDTLLASHLTSPKLTELADMLPRMKAVLPADKIDDWLAKLEKDADAPIVRAHAILARLAPVIEDKSNAVGSAKYEAAKGELLAIVALTPDDSFRRRVDGLIAGRESLVIGGTAPDIVGEDLDGVEFKLSDYRGKVVLLDFWGDW